MSQASVIIPVFNKWQLTKQCLESLAGCGAASSLEIVVVDNASSDETPSACAGVGRELFGDRFQYIRFETNRNFGPACNAGAEAASADTLFFLNNDTIATEGWLGPLLEELRSDHSLGAVGPLLLYPDDTVQHLGVAYYVWQTGLHLYSHVPRAHPVVRKRRRYQAITGAALMLPRQLFARLGGFHPGYVNGFEDLDLCSKIRGEGLGMTCVPESVIYHLESQSSGRFEKDKDNCRLFLERCKEAVEPDYHTLAREDGFETRITPLGQPYIAVPERRSVQYMQRFAKNPDLVGLWDFLQDEPLWEEGYGLCIASLEQAGMYQEALSVCRLQYLFFLRDEYLRKMITLATKMNNDSLALQIAESLDQHLLCFDDPAVMIERAMAHVDFFLRTGELELSRRCYNVIEEWLRSRSTPGI